MIFGLSFVVTRSRGLFWTDLHKQVYCNGARWIQIEETIQQLE
jgi:hypothetical protein